MDIVFARTNETVGAQPKNKRRKINRVFEARDTETRKGLLSFLKDQVRMKDDELLRPGERNGYAFSSTTLSVDPGQCMVLTRTKINNTNLIKNKIIATFQTIKKYSNLVI